MAADVSKLEKQLADLDAKKKAVQARLRAEKKAARETELRKVGLAVLKLWRSGGKTSTLTLTDDVILSLKILD